MWIITEIGFYSIVSYDQARDPRAEKPESWWRTYLHKGQEYGYWDYPKFVRPKRNPKVMVRARARIDLVRLVKVFKELGLAEPEILDWKMRDYPYRIVVLQRDWARVCHKLCKQINYTNFKNHIKDTDPQGSERSHVYMGIWSILNGLEDKLRPAKKKLGKATGRVVGSAAESARAFFGWGEFDGVAEAGVYDFDDEEVITETGFNALGDSILGETELSLITTDDITDGDLQAAAAEYVESLGDDEIDALVKQDEELVDWLFGIAYVGLEDGQLTDDARRDAVDFLHMKGFLPREETDLTDPFAVVDNPTHAQHAELSQRLKGLLPAELHEDMVPDAKPKTKDKRVTQRPRVRVPKG